MRDLETTAQIRREDLTDLLELEKAPAKQRTTAKMPAVTLTNLLTVEDSVALPTLAGSKRARIRGTRHELREMRPLTPPPAEMPPVVVKFRTTGPHAATAWPLDRWPFALSRGAVIALSAVATLLLARLVAML
ncbi:MAG TPA: hypothetical protein VLT45_17500 [Kofleriaceae bacterium]|nr:hypothetical protein [Kofleriaceae bacterium]